MGSGLITNPTVLEVTLPTIPGGTEAQFAQIIIDIRELEDMIEDCTDFNGFAFGHVEGQAVNDIATSHAAAQAEL